MSSEPREEKVHDLAGGWIQERSGTPVPLFLKLSYVGFSIFGLYYLFSYWRGEVGHASRGPFVEELNAALVQPGGAWLAFIAVCLGAFALGLLAYAFLAKGDDAE